MSRLKDVLVGSKSQGSSVLQHKTKYDDSRQHGLRAGLSAPLPVMLARDGCRADDRDPLIPEKSYSTLVLVPLIGFGELDKALGKGTLGRLLVRERVRSRNDNATPG